MPFLASPRQAGQKDCFLTGVKVSKPAIKVVVLRQYIKLNLPIILKQNIQLAYFTLKQVHLKKKGFISCLACLKIPHQHSVASFFLLMK